MRDTPLRRPPPRPTLPGAGRGGRFHLLAYRRALRRRLGDITVPVLYVGAGGGFGDSGLYTTTLLGSTDVTSHIVSLVPAAQPAIDFGHADLFQGTNAQSLVWQPILTWLQVH
jgi:hypothetical protein